MADCDTDTEGVWTEKKVIITESSENICPKKLSEYEARTNHPLYSFLYGPYWQHQFLVDTVLEMKRQNGVYAEMKGRLLPLAPAQSQPIGRLVALTSWLVNILLPLVFIVVCCLCYSDWMVCGCSIALCILITFHSIAVFFVLHNSKIVGRLWFVCKVDLHSYFDRENSIAEVTLETVGSIQFLSAGQRADVISRLARKPGKKAVMMVCARSFRASRILHPLLCLTLLIILCLAALIVGVDMLRRHHSF